MNSFVSSLSFRAEELGTGIRKVFNYSTLYSGKAPVFNENDLFEVVVPEIENTTKEAYYQRKGKPDFVSFSYRLKINCERFNFTYRSFD